MQAEEQCASLGAEVAGREAELIALRKAVSEKDAQLAALGSVAARVCDALGVPSPSQGGLAERVAGVVPMVAQLETSAFRSGVTTAFAVGRSHFDDSFDLNTLQHGFAPDYTTEEMVELVAESEAPAAVFTANFAPTNLPPRHLPPPGQ